MNFSLAIKLGFRLAWRLLWTNFSMFWAISVILSLAYSLSVESMHTVIFLMVFVSAMLAMWLAVYKVLAKIAHRHPELFRHVYIPLLLGRNVGKEEIESNHINWKTVKPLFFLLIATYATTMVWSSSDYDIELLLGIFIATAFISVFLWNRHRKNPGLFDAATAQSLLTERRKKMVTHFFADMSEPIVYAVPVFILIILTCFIPKFLSSEEKAFFQVKVETHPEENGFYAILGLGSSSDPMQAGLEIAKQLRAGLRADFGQPLLSEAMIKRFKNYGAMKVCRQHDVKKTDCLSLAEWKPILDENKVMLSRYEQLYRYKQFEIPLDIEKIMTGSLLSEETSTWKVINSFRVLMTLKS